MPGRSAKQAVLFGALVGLLLLASSASAGATVRFATPGGVGVAPCTNSGTPCTLFTANAQAVAGDEVLLAPGEYEDLAGDLGPQGALSVATGVRLRGVAGKPRPQIFIEDTATPNTVFVSEGAVLSGVEIRSSTVTRNVVSEGEVRGIVAVNLTEGQPTLVCEARKGVFRDSACLSERVSSAGIGVSMSASVLDFNATIRNVTAVAETGLKFEVSGDAQYTANVSNTIAKGRGAGKDVLVRALSPEPHAPGTGAQVQVNLDHSGYASTAVENDAGGGVATVTPAGAGSNITAAPQLQEDGYHQSELSPTVNAGSSQAGDAVDIDGQQRAIGAAPDIGADEAANATGIFMTCTPNPLVTGDSVARCEVFVADMATVQPSSPAAAAPPSGSVRLVPAAEGTFSNSGICGPLVPVDAGKSSCKVEYTPKEIGGGLHNFTSFYAGDSVHDSTSQPGFFVVHGVGGPSKDPGDGGGGKGGGGSGGGGGNSGGGGGSPGPGIAPGTALTGKPARRTSKRVAKFAFVSDQMGVSFECKLDKAPWKPCVSPFEKKGLKAGRHSFQVRAKNSAGMSDSTPAVYRWRVR